MSAPEKGRVRGMGNAKVEVASTVFAAGIIATFG